MTGPVQATPEGMARCAVRLDQAATAIRGIQGAVERANTEMLSTWNGQAATAFQGAMLSWNKETSDIIKALMWLQDMMTRGGRYYADSEEAVRQGAVELNNRSNLNTVGPASRPFFNG